MQLQRGCLILNFSEFYNGNLNKQHQLPPQNITLPNHPGINSNHQLPNSQIHPRHQPNSVPQNLPQASSVPPNLPRTQLGPNQINHRIPAHNFDTKFNVTDNKMKSLDEKTNVRLDMDMLPNSRPLKRSPSSPKENAAKRRDSDSKDDSLDDILPWNFSMENVPEIDANLFDYPDLEIKLVNWILFL